MTKKSIFAKLHDGKGIEWYHLVLVALVVGFLAFNQGLEKGALETQRCDTFEVIIRGGMFSESNLDIHPCDMVTFNNKDTRNYELQLQDEFFDLNVGKTHTHTFDDPGTYLFNTTNGPDSMIIEIKVE